jgi:ribosomal protein S12 methylthiotransferase accessory factor
VTEKGYTRGTHRLVDPEETIERIRPHLRSAGVTRCADVTGLDCLGIPVYCAIRPGGLALQVSSGKGIRHVDAQVSALMEAIEVHHAERPPAAYLRRTSLERLRRDGGEVIDPVALPGHRSDRFFSPSFVLDWVRGERLPRGDPVWLPASAVYLSWPALLKFDSNGLASGNDLVEATLHALYELIERDAVSRLNEGGHLRIVERCTVLDVATIDDPVVGLLVDALTRGGVELVLLAVPSRAGVATFWAVILDPNPFGSSSMVNLGYGTHLSPSVAASRAISEAAQSRLTLIHGSREDINPLVYESDHIQNKLAAYFGSLAPTASWNDLEDRSTSSLAEDYHQVLDGLVSAGHGDILRVVLSRPPFDIPVVKVFVPGLIMNEHLF